MRLVILESPYAGDVAANVEYARACLRDCLVRGDAPLASHLLYTQPGVLRDEMPDERSLGIEAGLSWGPKADATVVYTDRGISPGMLQGIERARREGRGVEFRTLPGYGAGGVVVRGGVVVEAAPVFRWMVTRLWEEMRVWPKIQSIQKTAVAEPADEPRTNAQMRLGR